jgi:hypothetical protein
MAQPPSPELIAHTKKVVQIVADRYDLDPDNVYNVVACLLRYDTFNLPVVEEKKEIQNDNYDKCYAFVKNKHGICRCARGKTVGNFCKTHDQQHKENNLTYGFFQPLEKKLMKKVERITIKNAEYYCESNTRKVYSIPENNKDSRFLGYLVEKNGEFEISKDGLS